MEHSCCSDLSRSCLSFVGIVCVYMRSRVVFEHDAAIKYYSEISVYNIPPARGWIEVREELWRERERHMSRWRVCQMFLI